MDDTMLTASTDPRQLIHHFRCSSRLLLMLCAPATLFANECHYQEWRWNVIEQRAVQHTSIVKDSALLTPEERDAASGCSVCEEDQQEIHVAGIPRFSVCKRYAAAVEDSLHQLLSQGEQITSVIGYRVGRSRGAIDASGNRTAFSNHSYGIAIDINSEHNGLYDRCQIFNAECRLLRGGAWRPESDPLSLKRSGPIVTQMRAIGFLWGGEIAGQQKDFMHFSPSGY